MMNCDRCGAPVNTSWCDITALNDTGQHYINGSFTCPTNGGGTTCPICHRPPGDIHSGACAPIVLDKLTDHTLVSTEDCKFPAAALGSFQ